jgi:hypothetical protein
MHSCDVAYIFGLDVHLFLIHIYCKISQAANVTLHKVRNYLLDFQVIFTISKRCYK